MSIVTHYYGVMGILAVIFLNLYMSYSAIEIKKHQRFMNLFMPISMTVTGMVIFSGVVMMAAKHLNFSFENILMIVVSMVLIIMENIRSKILQGVKQDDEMLFQLYKNDAYKILAGEIFLTLSISMWMLV